MPYIYPKLNKNIIMPVEPQDNTRVVRPPLIPPPTKEEKERMR